MSIKPMNIVYIHSHDTGRYVSPYGHAIDKPNIQNLAQEGVLFRKAFTANPTCSPSRACLLTGQWAHNNGMVGLAHRGSRLKDYSQHLGHVLRENGYTTALAGVQHVASDYEDGKGARDLLPYDHFLSLEMEVPSIKHQDSANAHRAVKFIKQEHDEPFFLSVGFHQTHRNGADGYDYQWHNNGESPLGDPRYVMPPAPLPDTPETRQDFADFKVAAQRLDVCMGAVFQAVKDAGIEDETLIICTTDHGIAYPHMKCSLTDHGIGVMLIIKGPHGFSGGKVCDAMVSQIDLFPTICELIGITAPDYLQGRSIMPLIRREAEEINEAVYATVNYHAAYEPKRAIRTTRYKYIRRYAPADHPLLPNCDDSISKLLLHDDHDWNDRGQLEEYLYDLIYDPHEAANVASDPAYTDVLDHMRDKLKQWQEKSSDPLLEHGFVEAWPHSVTTIRTEYSPGKKGIVPCEPGKVI